MILMYIIKLHKANVENIELVEETKKELPEDKKIKIFGPDERPIAKQIQSLSTIQLVKSIKQNKKI